ncbi:unnamed protein product [Closterium sp. Yama58-4]|nr:unnamed protein product [Closterium sp. Yama58-4]
MVLAHLRAAAGAIRQNGLIGALKQAYHEGYAMALLDGNLFETKRRALGARLVGTDSHGNKYYERMDAQNGRHRWVEYKESWGYNASTVPPEWHGWLHHITDDLPDKILAFKPHYGLEHRANFTGKGDAFIYHAKGHALNPNQRDWSRVQTWLPGSPDEPTNPAAPSAPPSAKASDAPSKSG